MARKARNETKPGLYHVFARGNNKETIFHDSEDREDYLLRLRLIAKQLGWRVLTYTLMGNHLHIVVQTRKPNLGDGMRALQGGFAQQFNRRYGRTGHVFGDRFGSVEITSDDQFRTTVRYVLRNPVKAQMTKKIGDWPWDSWKAIIRPAPRELVDVDHLLRLFAPDARDPLADLQAFVTAPP